MNIVLNMLIIYIFCIAKKNKKSVYKKKKKKKKYYFQHQSAANLNLIKWIARYYKISND